MNKSLIILTKFPEPGKVKTRLATDIGEEQAAEWAVKILDKLFENLVELKDKNFLKIYLKPYKKIEEFCNLFNLKKERIYPQPKGSLGDKMSLVFKKELSENDKVILIGSDTPDIEQEIISKTFQQLESNDVVLGPSTDGGYYLIAMSKYHPEVFQNVRWSHEKTLSDTIQQIERENLSYHLLEEKIDIDTIEDLNKININF